MYILAFKRPYTQYKVLHSFYQSLSEALERQGVKIEVTPFYVNELTDILRFVYQTPPSYTLAVNGLPPIPNTTTFIADKLGIPHVAWMVDSAYYYPEMAKSPYYVVISPDQTSRDQIQKLGGKHAYFMPHAFEKALTAPPEKERLYPLVFIGSLFDPIGTLEEWNQGLPEQIVKSLKKGADQVLFEPSVDVIDAFEKVKQDNASYFKTLGEKEALNLIRSFDGYIRAQDRIQLLKAFENLPLHIFGKSMTKRTWGDFLNLKSGSYMIHGELDFPQAIEVMRKAHIVINSTPTVKTGAHERLFYGLGLGALVLTNETPWLKTNFDESEGVLSYTLETLSQTVKKVEEHLNNPSLIVEKVKKGQEKVLKLHTWDERAKELITLLEKIKKDFPEMT